MDVCLCFIHIVAFEFRFTMHFVVISIRFTYESAVAMCVCVLSSSNITKHVESSFHVLPVVVSLQSVFR